MVRRTCTRLLLSVLDGRNVLYKSRYYTHWVQEVAPTGLEEVQGQLYSIVATYRYTAD
jgi:hypothetical protein